MSQSRASAPKVAAVCRAKAQACSSIVQNPWAMQSVACYSVGLMRLSRYTMADLYTMAA